MPVACFTCGANAHTTMPPPQATSSTVSPGLGAAASTIIRSALASVIGLRGAERRRLAGELIQDPLLVCGVAHGSFILTDRPVWAVSWNNASFSSADAPAAIRLNAFHSAAHPIPIFSTGKLLSNIQRCGPNSSMQVSI